MTSERDQRAANLFDLRRIIGGLFLVYGAILVVVGLADSDAAIRKAANVHVNLWAGIGMLVVGALFLAWAFARPLGTQLAEASEEPGAGTRRDGDRAGRERDAGRE
jgi:hypothetical protein